MLKKFILLLCLAAPLALGAQEKIAYVDVNVVMESLPEIKDAQTKIQTRQESLEKVLQGIQTEYQTEVESYGVKLEKFNKDGETSGVTEAELTDQQKKLGQIQERFQTQGETAQASIQQYQQELLAPVHEKIRKAIKEVGDEQNFLYILEASGLLYVNPAAVDATKFLKTKLGVAN